MSMNPSESVTLRTPADSPMADKSSVIVTWPWIQFFNALAQRSQTASMVAPAAADSPGTQGQIAYELGFLYICVAPDTWERVAVTTW